MFQVIAKSVILFATVCHVCHAESFFFTPHQSGTYNYDSGVAIFMSSKMSSHDDRKVLYVDFPENKVRVLSDGRMEYVSRNHNNTLVALAHSYKLGVRVINVDDGSNVHTVKGNIDRGVVRWADDINKLAYYDKDEKRVYEIDVDNNNSQSADAYGELYRILWDIKEQAFLFEFGPSQEKGLVGVYRLKNGLLEKSGVKTLNASPDGEYVFESISEFETENVFNVINRNGEITARLTSTSQVLAGCDLLWGKGTVRIVGTPSGNIELSSGKIVNGSTDFSSGNDGRFRWAHIRTDVASDKDGYVLIWNSETKIFEVEEVDTGKVIKTYEKFW